MPSGRNVAPSHTWRAARTSAGLLIVARFGTHAPYKPRVRTRAAATRRNAERDSRDARATNRYRVAKSALEQGGTLEEQYASVVHAIATGKLNGRAPEDPSTLWRWMQRVAEAEAAGQSGVDAVADRAGRGRPAEPLHPAVQAELERLARLAVHSARSIVATLKRFAEERRLPVPTEHKVRRQLDAMGYVHHLAAAQGSQAAQLDAVVHAAVPTSAPHEWWTGDTFKCPIPAGVYDPDVDDFVVLDPEVVVFMDNHTTAVVGYYVNDPSKRPRTAVAKAGGKGAKKSGGTHVRAYDQLDVQAAFLSAALPELAPPSTRSFGGRLPSKGIRLDVACQNMLRGFVAPIGVEIPELPGNSPPNRGAIECLVGMLKAKLATLPFARPLYEVATQTEKDDAKERVRSAPKKIRPHPKLRIAPRDYPSIEQVRAAVEEVILAYNMEHVPARGTMTPYQRYRAARGETAGRAGTDALRLLEHGNVIMQKGALDFRGMKFAANGTDQHGLPVRFPVRVAVEFRADPLLRGVFAYARGRSGQPACDDDGMSLANTPLADERRVFLPRMVDYARTAEPREIAREQRAEARTASTAARKARTEEFLVHLDQEAAARAAQYGEQAPSRRSRTRGRVRSQRRTDTLSQTPGVSRDERDAAGRGGADTVHPSAANPRDERAATEPRPAGRAADPSSGVLADPGHAATREPGETTTSDTPPAERAAAAAGSHEAARAEQPPSGKPRSTGSQPSPAQQRRNQAARRATRDRKEATKRIGAQAEKVVQMSFLSELPAASAAPADDRDTMPEPAMSSTMPTSETAMNSARASTTTPVLTSVGSSSAIIAPTILSAAGAPPPAPPANPGVAPHPLLSRWLAGDPRDRVRRVPLPS